MGDDFTKRPTPGPIEAIVDGLERRDRSTNPPGSDDDQPPGLLTPEARDKALTRVVARVERIDSEVGPLKENVELVQKELHRHANAIQGSIHVSTDLERVERKLDAIMRHLGLDEEGG